MAQIFSGFVSCIILKITVVTLAILPPINTQIFALSGDKMLIPHQWEVLSPPQGTVVFERRLDEKRSEKTEHRWLCEYFLERFSFKMCQIRSFDQDSRSPT